MRLTHYGHACVLVESDTGRRALLDPGSYSSGFETVRDLDLLLITHGHPDHVDAERLEALRAANPDAVLAADSEAAAVVGGVRRPGDVLVEDDQRFEAGGFAVTVTGRRHADIHELVPGTSNHGFVLDGRLWHPGDSFDAEPEQVEILLLPIGGPWMKLAEAVDFARAVDPRVIVPIHQAGLADVHRALHQQLLGKLTQADVVVLADGVPQAF